LAQAYIGLGSNKGKRSENINRAVWAISAVEGIKVKTVSGIYEAEQHHLGGNTSGSFAAIRVESELSAEMLLDALLEIEAVFGKDKNRNSEKTIDLDLLYFEGVEMDTERLTLPHKQLLNRPYVICTLLNLYPDSILKKRLRELGEEGIKLTGDGLYLPL